MQRWKVYASLETLPIVSDAMNYSSVKFAKIQISYPGLTFSSFGINYDFMFGLLQLTFETWQVTMEMKKSNVNTKSTFRIAVFPSNLPQLGIFHIYFACYILYISHSQHSHGYC